MREGPSVRSLHTAGDWTSAVTALKKAIELNSGGHAWDWFFLAMARWRLGENDAALRCYQKAVAWMDSISPGHEELRRIRREAAELLGVK